jgi:hypothetical protein
VLKRAHTSIYRLLVLPAAHPHVEGVVVQPVLQPEQSQVGTQRHLADAVAVEVKLVLSEV